MILIEPYPFKLMPLSYPYNALEPYIDAKTVEIHYEKHLKAYIDNLNALLVFYPEAQNWTIYQLLTNLHFFPAETAIKIKNNAGGIYTHDLYFEIMNPENKNKPFPFLEQAIKQTFGSWNKFIEIFSLAAKDLFGSGWVFLLADKNGFLRIYSAKNHDVNFLPFFTPIIIIDVWEHAYYLKYQNRRPEYINNWFNLVNWYQAEKNYLHNLTF